MKKTLLALMMLSAAAAYAGEAEDRLLSVQSVYRAALHEQNSNDSKIISLQSDLESAQRRLQAAQSERAAKCQAATSRPDVGCGLECRLRRRRQQGEAII